MKSVIARLSGFLLVLILGLTTSSLLLAQGGRGVVTGTVTDPSGAAIPNAAVTLTNENTGIVRSATTNTAGLYRFEFADVGSYTLKVAAQGFANFEVSKLIVTVGQTVVNDVQLELAKAAVQTITVEAEGVQLVNTADAQMSGLISRSEIVNLPLETRDAISFIDLMPGAVPDSFNSSTRGAAVNGQRGGTGNFMINGSDNNDYGQGGRSHNSSGSIPGGMTSISPDAVQEFRVVTNNFSAQYGRQGGFVADVVLRGGTNQVHGSAFEYNRNSKTTANDFFSNRDGLKDSLVRNQFGGSLGGPLIKDKMFLFGAVEIQRLRQNVPITATSTRQEFIDWVDSGGMAAFYGFDCTNPANASVCTLGPIFRELQSRYPMPLSTSTPAAGDYFSSSPIVGGTEYPVAIFGDASYSSHVKLNQNRWNLRWDFQASSKDTLAAHYVFDDFDEFDSGQGGDFYNGNFDIYGPARSQNIGLSWTHTFSPTVINEFRPSYLRHKAPFPRVTAPEIPSIGTADALYTGFGMSSSLPQNFTENTFQYQDSVSVIMGRHTIRFGGEYRRTRNGSEFLAEKDGIFYNWDTEDLLTDGALGDLLGFPGGGFYLAEAAVDPSASTPSSPEFYRGYRGNEFGFFVEDSFKINSRLTLTYGVRYDYFGVPHNFRPGLDSNFFFGSDSFDQCVVRNSNQLTYCYPGATNPSDPVWSTNPYFPINPYTAALFGGTFQQKDSNIWNKDTNNFAPRFGLAWDVRGNRKTVIRFGGGVFYDRMWNNLFENMRFNPPKYAFNQQGYLAGTVIGPVSNPGVYSIPIDLANFTVGASPSARHMDQGLVAAYSEQWNFDIQHELSPNLLLDVAYVGTVAHKLTGVADINTFAGRYFGSTRRINPNMGGDNMRANWYNSNYHSLQAQLTKRLSHGLTLYTNYAWSHALDYVSDAFNNRSAGGYRPQDNYNRSLEYGAADFDLRHRFLTAFQYELPFARSNRFLGGWSTNGTFTIQSGTPFTIYDGSNDSNGDGYYTDRAEFFGGPGTKPSYYIDHSKSPADGYILNPTTASGGHVFDTSFLASGDPANGFMARNALTGPAFANVDFSLSKVFKITETKSLRFMWASFNLLNHPNFSMAASQGDAAGGDITSPRFGRAQTTIATSSGTGGRSMQWSLRFDF